LYLFRKKKFPFCEIYGYKKGKKKICFPQHFLLFLDPGSGRMQKKKGKNGKKSGSGIRDKHPGCATLVITVAPIRGIYLQLK
jgi:hypothetical protein